VVDSGEACDDGNDLNTDTCLNDCTVPSCGDGFVQTGVEECDLGGANSQSPDASCRTDCTAQRCGDGVVDSGEACDDGNNVDGDGCQNTCVLRASSCLQILNAGTTQSGLYTIYPDGSTAVQTYCDMDRDGGGWTLVVQNNKSVPNNAAPVWFDIESGMYLYGGTLGNNLGTFSLWVGVSHWSQIGTESRFEAGATAGAPQIKGFYTLQLTGSTYALNLSTNSMTSQGLSISDMGMSPHLGEGLSTIDRDNDSYSGHCATSYGGLFWWYYNCWSTIMIYIDSSNV
jgi:cysteine-rich repeat protein